ncbi:unnamed protein product [Spirodela intermedia]|uniref:Uncharacterized protein n=1 Tax=Spirodela intermedia TaxID=51605 RepID=A0A7I8KN98_SPIIN|nr:unnamed protein product [Spirodela intermedia]
MGEPHKPAPVKTSPRVSLERTSRTPMELAPIVFHTELYFKINGIGGCRQDYYNSYNSYHGTFG